MNQYLAFISYRHIKRDQKVSFQLRKYLESFHLPASSPIPKHRKCFRDTDELPTSTDLGADIEHALENSDYLIAVCSEDYVKSKWCMREIELYIEHGKKERILPVLVSGTPETSIPAEIRDLPVALDLRSVPSGRVRENIPILLSVMSGMDASIIASADRKYRNLVLAGIAGGLGAIMAGLISYSLLTARRIEQNNKQIALATTQAVEAESEAEEQIYENYLKRTEYLSQKAWTQIRQGNDLDALRLTMSLMPDASLNDLPDYALYLPDPVAAVDAMRAALSMPQRQRIPYRYWVDYDIWEYVDEDIDDPDEIDCPLTGRFIEISGHRVSDDTFQDKKYLLESAAPDGRYFCLSIEEGWPELTEEYDNSDGSLFRNKREDLLKSLPVDDTSACVAINPSGAQAAVIDSSGHLSLYLTQNGQKTGELKGTWEYVTYANENYRLYAVSSDGEFKQIDALTLETERIYDLPRPAKTASYCAKNNTWLIAADHFAFVLDAATGEILSGNFFWGEPVACAWEGFDEISYTHDGNGYIIICRDQVHVFLADTMDNYGSQFLFALEDYSVNCTSASYSPDSRYICLQYENGDISCWDLWSSDPFLWTYQNRKGIGDSESDAVFSRDGTSIWVPAANGYGIENFDAITGELLLSVSPYQKSNTAKIRESGVWSEALSVGASRDDPLILFSSSTGEVYKSWDGVKDACFSEDGESALCLDIRPSDIDSGSTDGQASKYELVYRVIDLNTYDVTQETALCTLDEGKDEEIIIDQDNLTAAVGDTLVVNLRKLYNPDASDETESPEDMQYPDETESQDDTDVQIIVKKTSPSPVFFAGEEAFIQNSKNGTRLVNAEDGHTIIDAGDQQIALSPDGDSATLYGNDQTSYCIFAQDQDTLFSEALSRLDQYEEEMQEWLDYSEEDYNV